MTDINRVALGLLGLFDIKAQGRNPGQLSDALSTVLDAWDFYISPYTTPVGAPVAVTSVGSFIDPTAVLTVPERKVWFVEQALAFSSAAVVAGVTMSGRCGVYDSQQSYVRTGEQSISFTAGNLFAAVLPGRFAMFPGQQLGFLCTAFAGVSQQIQIAVRRLEVAL